MGQGRLADLLGQLIEVTQLHLIRAEDRAVLLLTVELNQKTYSLRFSGVHSLSIDSFSPPFQIGGFQIEDNLERGWERSERYTVSDFEAGKISFICEEIELSEVRTRSGERLKNEINGIVCDFLAGRIGYDDFIQHLEADESILDWLDGLYSEEMLTDEWLRDNSYLKELDGSFKRCFRDQLGWNITDRLYIFNFTYHYVKSAFPTERIERTAFYDDLFYLYLDSEDECYGGPEVEGLITPIILSIPTDIPYDEQVELARERVKALFPAGKVPEWIDEPEWPLGVSGKPMVFVSGKKKGDLFEYTFKDPATGQQRVIDQYA